MKHLAIIALLTLFSHVSTLDVTLQNELQNTNKTLEFSGDSPASTSLDSLCSERDVLFNFHLQDSDDACFITNSSITITNSEVLNRDSFSNEFAFTIDGKLFILIIEDPTQKIRLQIYESAQLNSSYDMIFDATSQFTAKGKAINKFYRDGDLLLLSTEAELMLFNIKTLSKSELFGVYPYPKPPIKDIYLDENSKHAFILDSSSIQVYSYSKLLEYKLEFRPLKSMINLFSEDNKPISLSKARSLLGYRDSLFLIEDMKAHAFIYNQQSPSLRAQVTLTFNQSIKAVTLVQRAFLFVFEDAIHEYFLIRDSVDLNLNSIYNMTSLQLDPKANPRKINVLPTSPNGPFAMFYFPISRDVLLFQHTLTENATNPKLFASKKLDNGVKNIAIGEYVQKDEKIFRVFGLKKNFVSMVDFRYRGSYLNCSESTSVVVKASAPFCNPEIYNYSTELRDRKEKVFNEIVSTGVHSDSIYKYSDPRVFDPYEPCNITIFAKVSVVGGFDFNAYLILTLLVIGLIVVIVLVCFFAKGRISSESKSMGYHTRVSQDEDPGFKTESKLEMSTVI